MTDVVASPGVWFKKGLVCGALTSATSLARCLASSIVERFHDPGTARHQVEKQGTDAADRSRRQRYKIIRKIDAGGMAEIFLAKAQSIGGMEKQVAIKRVLPSLTSHEQFVTMFLDEARLSMGLNHANIVSVFDVGQSGETYFIVMEYVHGHNLRRIFQRATERGYRIPLEIACFIVIEVCKGLNYAHDQRDEDGQHLHIVHRDLSPPNILISRDGEVKITDFGLAKAMSHLGVTEPGVVKGKYSYLSPEAASGEKVDHRADIFAAGVCLWELLAGRRLFMGKSDLATVELVRAAEVPRLSATSTEVTPAFEEILDRALTPVPKKRYTTAREFGDALAEYLFAHGLKVTSFDLAHMVAELHDELDETAGSPEERITALIHEEILNLSIVGFVGEDMIDGSQVLRAEDLEVQTGGRLGMENFWSHVSPEVESGEHVSEPGAPRLSAPARGGRRRRPGARVGRSRCSRAWEMEISLSSWCGWARSSPCWRSRRPLPTS